MKERIAKRIAASGVCSRRQAERLIDEGAVTLNGETVRTPATLVDAKDHITVQGKPLASIDHAQCWIYHKPRGQLTTHHDPKGRPTVFEALPKSLPRVISIGRLDYNTEGLLLLTNSGALARAMELPQNAFSRSYRVRVDGAIDPRALTQIRQGVTIDGMRYKPAEITVDSDRTARNQWLSLTLTEGKNREVRKLCEFAGLEVSRLIRTSYGPFLLNHLAVGQIIPAPAKKLQVLLKQFNIT